MLIKKDVVVYFPTYCDVECIKRGTRTILDLGFSCMVGDGRYTDFPQIANSNFSRDGTEQWCKDNDIYYFQTQPMREQDKVNRALELARQHGFQVFIMIGADAYLEGDSDEFMLNLQREYERVNEEPVILQLHAKELQPGSKWNNTAAHQPRVWFTYWKMEARNLHWVMYVKGARDDDPIKADLIYVDGLTLFHDNSLRPKKRDQIMSSYQDVNVERERQIYLDEVTKRAHKIIKIMVWKEDDGPYPMARERFLKLSDVYSHLLFVKKRQKLLTNHVSQFYRILNDRNNILQELKVITAVWRTTIREHSKFYSLAPYGCDQKLPTKAVQQMYSREGTPFEADKPISVAAWTAGPAVCLEYTIVRDIENMGDDLDFVSFLMAMGVQMFADTRIQMKWVGR